MNYIGVRVGRGPYSEKFTARQLMSHLSGLDGDLFADVSRDNDALAKYMIVCRQLEFMAPPGRYYNYSNAGYAVLGRLLEVVRGDIYDRILDKHLFGRLGSSRSTSIPEIAAFRRTASGHSLGPGRCHAGGAADASTARAGTGRPLSLFDGARSCGLCQSASGGNHASIPQERRADAHAARGAAGKCDLGTGLEVVNGEKVIFVGHDGGTIGQVASLWTSPVHGLAVAMCANGGLANRAWDHVAYPIFREVCGEAPELRPPPPAPAPRVLALYEGDYDNLGVTMYVRAKDDRLAVRAKIKSYAASDIQLELHPVGDDKFRTTIGGDDKVIMQFLDPDKAERPQLFYAGRLHKRKAGPA